MKKTRIIKIETQQGTWYQIQQKSWLFGRWDTAEADSSWGDYTTIFTSLEGAKANLKYFDGSIPEYKVVG